MPKQLFKVVVFIPAYNEEASIEKVINDLTNYYKDSGERGFIIQTVLVDDGSTDNTLEFARRSKITKIVSHPYNLGLGAATRTGMEEAYNMGADAAIKFDADYQHRIEDIEHVIRPILEERCDICWGSRFKGRINYQMPFIRRFGNAFFTWLMNRLTKYRISDAQTGMMAFNRKYLSVFEILGDYNPPQQLLIDAYKKKMRYCEVPVTFESRKAGKSFVSLVYPLKVFSYILRTFVYSEPFKIFGILGFVLMLFSLLMLIAFLILKMANSPYTAYFLPNIMLSLFLSGLQTFFFGIIADMILKKTGKTRNR